MHKSLSISIIIPNYNGKELLKKNLHTVISISEDKRVKEIIIVDDQSTDDSVAFLKENFSQVRIIERVKNEGFASTVNTGVKIAVGDIVLLLNHDVFPKPGFIKPLLQYFDDKTVFAVGCLQECKERDHIVKRGRGIGSFHRGFLIHKRGAINKTDTLWVSGGAGAFRKSVWRKLGGMDQIYNPFYWEDIDLSYRALKAGYHLVFEPKSIVIHEQHKGVIRQKFSPLTVKEITYRNQFIFFWKNITDWQLWIQHIVWFFPNITHALLRNDKSFILGLLGALKLLPRIIKRRCFIHEIMKNTDKSIVFQFRER